MAAETETKASTSDMRVSICPTHKKYTLINYWNLTQPGQLKKKNSLFKINIVHIARFTRYRYDDQLRIPPTLREYYLQWKKNI